MIRKYKCRGTFYIYVLLNSDNYVKIGITKNFDKRKQSLSGSNGGGSIITDYFVSPETYVYNLEKIMHELFKDYRIPNTEWFKGIEFNEVVKQLQQLLSSEAYRRTNEELKLMNCEEECL